MQPSAESVRGAFGDSWFFGLNSSPTFNVDRNFGCRWLALPDFGAGQGHAGTAGRYLLSRPSGYRRRDLLGQGRLPSSSLNPSSSSSS
jgi:hypothetical protein